jgi:dihydroorotate dehydrogenase
MSYFLKPLLFALDPELAHNLAIGGLKYFPRAKTVEYSSLENSVFGINFKNPVGMAAGFDKNAEVFSYLHNFGFGFVECGTVTPLAQSGNPKPRLFRLTKDQGIINRLGFNNRGIEYFLKNIQSGNENQITGINIGKNKDTINALDDYLLLLDKVYSRATYITINISSPNTKNLRDLQKADELEIFLAAIMSKKNQLEIEFKKSVPILVKIAPDLNLEEQKSIAKIALENKIDGLIISNTTIKRDNLTSELKSEIGGLSGKPLFAASNEVLKNIYQFSAGKIPLIGVGGISCGQDAYQKIKLGASLVQIYSAFIYQGFGLVEKIKKELDEALKKDGFRNIREAIGVENKIVDAAENKI